MKKGFTLIEVLLALAVIAIAFVALSKASSSNIVNATRLKDKTLAHWTAMNALNLLQLNLIQTPSTETLNQKTIMLKQEIYWQAKIQKTPFKQIEKIEIAVSHKPEGPFHHELTGFRYLRPST